MFCLGIKGDADLEVKAGPARQDWEQAKSLAEQLGDKQWANRASGELGLVNFLEGNYHQASYLVGHTLLTAIRDGDIGTQVRYLEIIGNGLNGLNRPSEGMVFCNRAIAIADRDKDVGTPFMALEGKAEALLLLSHKDQAQALMERTLAEARSERMWEHEGQDLLILAEFAMDSGNKTKAREYLQDAIQSEKRVGLVRVVEQSTFIYPGCPKRRESCRRPAMNLPGPSDQRDDWRYDLFAAHLERDRRVEGKDG